MTKKEGREKYVIPKDMKLTLEDVIEMVVTGSSIIPYKFVQIPEFNEEGFLQGLHVEDGNCKRTIYLNTEQGIEDMRKFLMHELYHGKLRLNRIEQDEDLVEKLTNAHYNELYK